MSSSWPTRVSSLASRAMNKRARRSAPKPSCSPSWLDRVAAPLPVPFHVEADFTLHHMLHGTATSRADLARLDDRSHDRLLDAVAQLLAEFASAAVARAPVSPATTSAARLAGLKERALQHVVPLMWQHQRDWFRELFEAVEQTAFDAPPCMIHGDLAPYHVLHDPETGELTGILDFGVAGLGDPAVDLACLLTVWGESESARLLSSYAGDVATVERARLVASALPVEWAVLAIELDAPDMAVAHLGHAAQDLRAITRSPAR